MLPNIAATPGEALEQPIEKNDRAIKAIRLDRAPAPGVHRGAKILHAARAGRKAGRFILYKAQGGDHIVIGRILHDAMDIERHIPPVTAGIGGPARNVA